jgi:hypothetical protein
VGLSVKDDVIILTSSNPTKQKLQLERSQSANPNQEQQQVRNCLPQRLCGGRKQRFERRNTNKNRVSCCTLFQTYAWALKKQYQRNVAQHVITIDSLQKTHRYSLNLPQPKFASNPSHRANAHLAVISSAGHSAANSVA